MKDKKKEKGEGECVIWATAEPSSGSVTPVMVRAPEFLSGLLLRDHTVSVGPVG